jgi:high-affinity Fe2+/Pb2+ permease
MSWSPSDTQPRDPHLAIRTARKVGAMLRWVVLVGLCGLAIAAVLGIAISLLVTTIENGL